MIRSLKDLDKSVNESKTRMKSDVERSLRGLNFGKLYLKNGEFETAIKYVNEYLSVRPNSSEGYKLLAQINEAIGDDNSAISYYRKSLDLRKQNSDNLSFVTPTKNESFSSSITTSSPLLTNNIIDNNNSTINTNTKPLNTNEKKEVIQTQSHSCGTCSNQNVLNKIAKQQQSLIETNKIILDVIKQNSTNINDIQQQLVIIHDSLSTLTDSQNVLKETLYDYVTQEHEGFEDYDPDDKDSPSFDASGLLNANESDSNQWHSSSLQTESQLDHKKPLSELFKPPTNSWQCEVCYVQNNASLNSCMACESPNPNPNPNALLIQPQANQGFKLTNSEPFSFQPTIASNTSGFNFGPINTNEKNSIFSNNTFKFGNTTINNTLPSFSSNSFFPSNKPIDQSSQNIFPTNTKTNASEGLSFQFGLSRDFDFKFSENVEKEEAFKSPKSPAAPNLSFELQDENSSFTEHPEPSNADSIYFQPVVPLPPKIEVKTGEEEEKVLHLCRAKLFRFSENEWKERGIGELKILLSSDSKRIRMVMRRDTVLKVCLNQYITPELKLDLKEDKKSITWSAVDYSEDTPTPEVFLLRLKNPENAELFIEAFKSAQILLKEESVSDKSKTDTVSDPSKVGVISNASKVQIVSAQSKAETIPDKPKVEAVFGKPKEETVFGKPQVEAVFGKPKVETAFGKPQVETVFGKPKVETIFGKPQVEAVFGKPQVETVFGKPQVETVFGKPKVETVFGKPQVEVVFGKPQVETVSDKLKTEKVSDSSRIKSESKGENIPSKVSDDDCEVIYVKMPESEELLKKTIDLKLPLNFYDYLKMPPCPGCRGCHDEVPAVTPIRQTLNESLTSQTQSTVQESLFSSAIAASNVNQTNWQTTNNAKPLWLIKTPSPIFKERNADEDDESVLGNADIYFKPLIPLPELIEVKTGEEDEKPIYCQRAKLYRYDPSLKEWKERGIGDFKILKHKDKNRYRMILRREQILKIACNHYITTSMDLKPMNTSETAICWYAVDYTEGNPTEEQFALKLKNKDLLQEFIKVFTKCKKDLENYENSVDLNHSAGSENQNDGDEDTDVEEYQEQD